MKKRILTLIIAGLLTVTLCACGSDDTSANNQAADESKVEGSEKQVEDEAKDEAEDEVVALDSEEMGKIAEKSIELAELMQTVAELGWEDEQTETEMKAVTDAANALTALMNGEETIKMSEVDGLLADMDAIIEGISENTIPRIVESVDGNVVILEGTTWVICGGTDGENELNQEQLDEFVEEYGNITINFTSDSEFEMSDGEQTDFGTYEILNSVITMNVEDTPIEATISFLEDGTKLLILPVDDSAAIYFSMVE